jgi:hypothetical protein
MTPIEYIERRLGELRAERPTTQTGKAALRIVMAELEIILLKLKVDALTQLQRVMHQQLDEVTH